MPPKQEMCPSSEDCAPKESNGLGATGVHFGPSSPTKCWFSPRNSWARTVFSCRFRDKDFFLVFTLEFKRKKFCAPTKIVYMPLPPSHAILAPGLK